MTLSEIAPAKVNLALHVRRRRPDGYHDIESLFAFCAHGDRLSAEPAGSLTLEVIGPFADALADEHDNLVLRAARLLGQGRGARLRLEKTLPVAAGLGGGSADAACALRLLSRLWDLDADLPALARRLGADVPACIESVTARGEGRGDVLTPIVDNRLRGMPILLANPRLPMPTGPVFAAWDGVDRGPLKDWREGRNDLEAPARRLLPAIGEVLSWLSAQPGATVARMSGSGATCFALFDALTSRDRAAASVPARWWHLASTLR